MRFPWNLVSSPRARCVPARTPRFPALPKPPERGSLKVDSSAASTRTHFSGSALAVPMGGAMAHLCRFDLFFSDIQKLNWESTSGLRDMLFGAGFDFV